MASEREGRRAPCVQASELLAADVVLLALEHGVLQSGGVVLMAGKGTKRLTAALLPERSRRCLVCVGKSP